MPDLDSVLGIVAGDFKRFHNNATHSLVVGLGVASVIGGVASLKSRSRSATWFLVALSCYESHVIMDFFTHGRGVMAFWPLTSGRFLSPVTAFYGLHWSDGVLSMRHLVTMITELAFTLLMVLIVRLRPFRRERGSDVLEYTRGSTGEGA
jgi:hypothetical protein